MMTWRRKKEQQHLSEYYALILAVVLGSHLLVMSMNLIMVFLSLELISISSYVLAGFSFSRKGSEGSLKYFLFGSVASAVMLAKRGQYPTTSPTAGKAKDCRF